MNTYDVAIVGAGIIGVSCGFALAEAGLRVVVFDRQTPGMEASWAAGGMLSPAPYLPDDDALTPLGSESLRLYPEFVRAIESAAGKPTGYRREGATELFFDEHAAVERNQYVARCRKLGLNVEAISGREIRLREPTINVTALEGAWFEDEATIEPRALMAAAIGAARARGVEIRANSPVNSLLFEGNRCVGVLSLGERIAAGCVLIAAGAFSRALARSDEKRPVLGACLVTHPVRGQMIALRSRSVKLTRAVRSARGYLVPRADGTIVAGSTLEDAGFEKKVTPEGIRKIRGAAAELIPDLANAEIVDTWCGLRPGTPDGLPILGFGEAEGVIAATGHFRNGILLAAVTAKLVKDLVTHGKTSIAAEVFSPLRFARIATQVRSAG